MKETQHKQVYCLSMQTEYLHLYQLPTLTASLDWKLCLLGLAECFSHNACMLSHFSHVWLCNPINCNLPGSSVHGILQARILEWVAMPSFRGSSWPGDWTWVSLCLRHWQPGSLLLAPPGKPLPHSIYTVKAFKWMNCTATTRWWVVIT